MTGRLPSGPFDQRNARPRRDIYHLPLREVTERMHHIPEHIADEKRYRIEHIEESLFHNAGWIAAKVFGHAVDGPGEKNERTRIVAETGQDIIYRYILY